jgi:hypothetical protein
MQVVDGTWPEGTLQEYDPEFGIAVAIVVENVKPLSDESLTLTFPEIL